MSRILVVEDSRTQAEQVRVILKAQGFEVEVAPDGQSGLNVLYGSPFDLVITDVLMPCLSGFELCRKIKDDPARRHIPVILLTSLQDPEDILQGIECGADNFIPKPYRADDLIAHVRGLFASRALRAGSKFKVGIEAFFLGKKITINSDKEQILDLLLSSCEAIVRTNRALQASQAELHRAKAMVEQHNDRLRDQARSSEERYRTLMEQANDAIFLLDTSGAVREANRRAEQLLGRPRADIIGTPFRQFVPAAEEDRTDTSLQKLLAGEPVRLDNMPFKQVNGTLVYADYSASFVEVGGEAVIFIILHDATERNRLEQQLRQSQKMEAVGQLAGGVAHDFNNLLTIITGYSEVLLNTLPRGDSMRAPLGEIKHAGDRAASLTRQLLSFSRQQVVAPTVLDLNAVVADSAQLLRRLIGEDIEVTCALDPALGRVKADSGQIEQVLMNLVVNGRDAMPKGGKLIIETANVELDEEFAGQHLGSRAGHYVLLAVSDSGCGMDEATRNRIFDPFFTTKEKGKGTGLGLAVVYGIIKQAGGLIYVYSEPGRGSSLKIYLPRVESSIMWERTDPGQSPNQGGTETILLVEDEEAVRRLTRLALHMNGYSVLEASHVEEALHLAEEHAGPIHLLVTDVVMPKVSGRELADQLTSRRPGLKVLYLSGYTDDAVVRHGVLEAAVAFLQKPFAVSTLTRKVREVLDKEDCSPDCLATSDPYTSSSS